MVDTPDEKTKDKIFDKYYKDEFKQKMMDDPDFQRKILDEDTRKTEIHNIVFNKTSSDAQKTYKSPGNIRKYGVVKNSNKWFEEKVLKEAKQLPSDYNLISKFPERYSEFRSMLDEFGMIRTKIVKNFRGKGEDVIISEIRNKRGHYKTWKVVGRMNKNEITINNSMSIGELRSVMSQIEQTRGRDELVDVNITIKKRR